MIENYDIGVQQTPMGAFAGGYQVGSAIRDDIAQQNAIRQQQEAQLQQQKAINGLLTNPRAGANDYAAASLLFPQLKDQVKQAWEIKNTAQQESMANDHGQVFAALQNGKPQIAKAIVQRRADILEAQGGDPKEIQLLRTQGQIIDADPNYARTSIGMFLAANPAGQKVLTSAAGLGAEQRAQDKAPAELVQANAKAGIETVAANNAPTKTALENANTQSQIDERAARLGLDKDKLTTETQLKLGELRQKAGELPEPVIKNINDATGEAIASQQSAAKMNDVAQQLEGLGNTGWGAAGSANEYVRKTLGLQNGLSDLRAQYNRIVTPAAMAAYKQVASGSTSDKDIETAMLGVPKDTASTDQMASYLRGAAKLQVYNSVLNNAKSEWFAANKHLGKISQDANIDGVQVPKGTTFKQFADDYVAKKVGQVQGAQTVNSLAAKYGGGQ